MQVYEYEMNLFLRSPPRKQKISKATAEPLHDQPQIIISPFPFLIYS